ncbi:MAG: T9SS type A sorting domain-containing protein [Flavobacteriales bacterium]|nr:T9SS type A sorting domain-containing protein [Flavobacteriales bacterium]
MELLGAGGSLQWELRDMAGARVLSGTASVDRLLTLDLSRVSNGAYMLVIQRGGARSQHRVVKH